MRTEKGKALTTVLLFLIPILLILWYWKNTLIHLGTHLYDWHDVPFVIWILQNNIKSIGLFDFIYHNETNAMYPFSYSLSFTEHMYFPSLITYAISWFTSNPIAQFNILAVFNHVMVYVSAWLLAGRFSRNPWVRAGVGFFMAFSPFMYLQSGHFQIIFIWPILLSLYFLLNEDRQLHHILLAGLFLAWQFQSSVYIGIMGLFVIAAYYAVRLWSPRIFPYAHRTKKELETSGKAFLFGFYTKWDKLGHDNRLRALGELGIILLVFLILCEPMFEAYLEMYRAYKPVLEQGQYVNYAAHISDYLFPSGQSSLLYRFLGLWRGLNHHTSGELAAFVGFVPLGIAIYWAKGLGKKKGKPPVWLIAWVAVIGIVAFVFSLGPRFNFNGKYLVAPLPYLAILKTVPFIGVMRALARWYFVIILAVSFIMAAGMESMSRKFLPVVFVLLIVEFYPAPLPATVMNWRPKAYDAVKKICSADPAAMLEYPLDYRAKDYSVSKDLTYKNTILMASTTHNCDILSGFTAYQPKKYIEYRDFLQNHDFNRGGVMLLYNLGFRYVKFNLPAMNDTERKQITRFLRLHYVTKMYEDKNTIIVKLRQLSKYEMIEPVR